MVQPEDIASATALLLSDEARFITGTTLPVDADASARMPNWSEVLFKHVFLALGDNIVAHLTWLHFGHKSNRHDAFDRLRRQSRSGTTIHFSQCPDCETIARENYWNVVLLTRGKYGLNDN